MKRGNKLISFLLAFVLIVTAVPDNGIVGVREAKAAQANATQTKAAEETGLVKWQPVGDDDSVTVSEDQTVKATERIYDSFYYSGTLYALESSWSNDEYEVNEERVKEVLGVTGTVANVTPSDFSYQWYEVKSDGKQIKLEGKTARNLYISDPSYADEGGVYATNAEKEKTFVCVLTLESVRIGGSEYTLTDDEELAASGELSIEREFTLKYTGKVAEKSQISDYFSGVQNLKDETIAAHYKEDCYNYVNDSLRVSEISGKEYSSSRFNYRWTVHYMDGTEKLISERTNRTYIASESGSQFDENGKQVDYYECEIDLCYGYQIIDTVSKKIFYRYEPFYFNGDAEVTQSIRKNATVEMDVKAYIADTEAVVPGTLAYQWYEIDAKGNEKKLKNETTSSYTVRVPDPSVAYKIEVTAEKQKDFDGPEFDEVLTRTFRFTASDGYLLKDISDSSYSMNIGDTQKLYVEPKVDDGYKLEYQWEKVAYEKDEDGNYVYEEDGYTRKIASSVVGKSNMYEVKPKDISDFETIYAYDGENNQPYYNYRVTVKVKKGDEVVDTHVYTFRIGEDIHYDVIEQSDSKLSLNPGDDLELFVKTKAKDCYTLKQTWYKKAGVGVATAKINEETGETTYISLHEEEFKIPKKYDRVDQGSYEGYYELKDGESALFYRYTFWEKVADGAVYTEKGMKSGKIVDVRGEYQYCMEMYRAGNKKAESEEEEEPLLASATKTFTVSYDSDLSAYAKSLFPTVKEGEKAKLRVVAQTKNDAYKIHYKWEKLVMDDEGDDTYEEIKDSDSPVYEIAKAKSEDAGRYRVTVTDEYDGTCSPIDIYLSVQKNESTEVREDVTHICYTPSQSTYELGIGQKVNLKLDMKLSDPNVDVFYAWYRNEKVAPIDSWDDSYKENWELLGEDKNTYKLEVKGEDDFTTYRCMAVYRKNDTEYAKTEVKFDVRQGYTAELEKMTASEQIKKRGDSASYTVRLITDDPDLSVKYQWYREDGTKISGATEATYEVAELKKGDFGKIYCIATDSETGEMVAQRAYFTTRIYRNGAYLEKNYETVEAAIGDAQTVLGAPVIERGEGLELTYQWYRGSTIIYGATEPTYTIEEIGDNEFKTYRCAVYADGDFLADYYTTVAEKEEDGDEEEGDLITVSVPEGYETSVKAFLGSGAKFAVTAESKKELALRYQWYYSSNNSYSGYAIGGATESTYEIVTVTSSKKGYYYCVVMNEEGEWAYSERFSLTTTTGLEVETEGYNTSDAISVQTSFGAQDVVLTATATASTEHGYTPFYQWYHETMDDKGLIYGANSQVLTLPAIDEDALGMYYCTVKDSSGADYTLKYYVYVNNGLNVVPSTYYVLTGADGSARMYVTATANAGCEISYQWSKYGKDEDGEFGYIDIEGATQNTYVLSPLKSEDYGSYRCKISTVGERNYYGFSIQPDYTASADRDFAGQGDVVTVTAELENQASDLTYSYQWYEQDPATRTYRKVKGGTSAVLSKTVPALDLSEQFTGNDKLGYVSVGYRCVITIGEGEDTSEEVVDTGVAVLPDFTYRSDVYPETNHPNDKSFDLQAYRAAGAQQLKITFDDQTELGSAGLYLIDKEGKCKYYSESKENRGKLTGQTVTVLDELAGQTITVSGDSIVLLMNGNRKADSYGYKVSNIEAVYPPQPPAGGQQGGANNGQGSAVKAPGATGTAAGGAAAKKGKKYTIKNVKYKVTSATAKKKTVAVIGAKSKKAKIVNIPATVKIGGKKYKVTAISAKAFQGYSKLKSVTIGKNVKSIGANAFAKDKKLKSITVKGTAIKSVGKKAFANVPKKAVAKAPKKSKKAYKKLFKKGAFKGKVK